MVASFAQTPVFRYRFLTLTQCAHRDFVFAKGHSSRVAFPFHPKSKTHGSPIIRGGRRAVILLNYQSGRPGRDTSTLMVTWESLLHVACYNITQQSFRPRSAHSPRYTPVSPSVDEKGQFRPICRTLWLQNSQILSASPARSES